MLSYPRALIKIIIFSLTAVYYFITVLPLLPLLTIWPSQTRKILSLFIQKYARFCLSFMGIKVTSQVSDHSVLENQGELFICNHLSYLDMLVLSSIYPTCFVTSKEIRETPFWGSLAYWPDVFLWKEDHA